MLFEKPCVLQNPSFKIEIKKKHEDARGENRERAESFITSLVSVLITSEFPFKYSNFLLIKMN